MSYQFDKTQSLAVTEDVTAMHLLIKNMLSMAEPDYKVPSFHSEEDIKNFVYKHGGSGEVYWVNDDAMHHTAVYTFVYNRVMLTIERNLRNGDLNIVLSRDVKHSCTIEAVNRPEAKVFKCTLKDDAVAQAYFKAAKKLPGSDVRDAFIKLEEVFKLQK